MTAALSQSVEDRPIEPGERSGVLHPANLALYDARRIDPDAAVATVVDQYWHVSWTLGEGESVDQRIIDLPAVTITIEEGDVPAPLVVTGVQEGAWRRTIVGRGTVFAVRLRPAGLATLSDLTPERIADATLPVTERLDARLYDLMRRIADRSEPAARARAAAEAIRAYVDERPPSATGLLANDVLDELRARLHDRTGVPLSECFHVHARTIQRALRSTLGHGPKWISRRLRLQEVARTLAARPDDDLAGIAAELGYADQSHLTGDFRSVAGIAPSTYRHDLARLRGV